MSADPIAARFSRLANELRSELGGRVEVEVIRDDGSERVQVKPA